jgi:ATP-dependent Clp protease ATP-binding subunit ClpB
VDFKNTIIILTSNIGSQYLLEGIGPDGQISEEARNAVTQLLRGTFRPEFLNRLDEIVFYKPLTKENICRILDLQLKDLERRLAERNLGLEVTYAARKLIADSSFDPLYGARPMKRYVQSHVETLIARSILESELSLGDTLIVDEADGKLTVRKK